jgi:cytochrome c-type biogenesis protein CcmF
MISCFWEGQEGSFLLWIFWNSIIALILRRTAGKWESPVIAIIGLGQIALGSMLLGFHWGDLKIGSSPFDLLRDVRPEFLNIPILGSIGVENYLQVFKDGNGLNKLLQNYWMVIHPPTLFLGFALAIVPFAYSVAALWKRDVRSWIHPAIIWSLACVGILGAGIIMGGFWAYESLSFGGYWAWDPVENASLLPWLIMTSHQQKHRKAFIYFSFIDTDIFLARALRYFFN